eukprot:CAMPEP_0119050730 /NCGR_PEP_ID=MMETSP1177-20130426/71397_1 /TAXON_ID=2985 /ORGANISM="Ochromonas sp, Strain CCMP1899" /LENGTH=432 /DNA_ID=CAMNT_0007029447 /DNA_START=184 /DNA_END=1482 /DNA_ORIENTATION=-
MVKSNGFTPPPSRTADEIIKENDTNSIAKKDIIVDNESTKLPHNPDESIEHTTVLNIVDPLSQKKWPLFSLLDIHGKLLPNAKLPVIEKDHMLQMYRMMTRIKILDDVFFNAQRQGRISFYMQNTGEEAVHIGSAAALHADDVVFAQYREVGVLLWRGFTVQQVADQCFGNEMDLSKGRSMPIHYGSKEHNFQTMSSPLATQMPHAVGAAYSLKLSKKDAIAICYFGEGAASEGDFHAALNMAATLETPMIFLCRNNGYAISTPVSDQYRGDGIISRAAGYGMRGIRVDGNDVFAIFESVKEARRISLEHKCPVLIEVMTYRGGHHSTSDDSTRYRNINEIKNWSENYNPIKRFKSYLINMKYWNDNDDTVLNDRERIDIIVALETAEKRPKPSVEEMFNDVYSAKPKNLIHQEKELYEHLRKFPNHYTTDH